MEEPTLNVHNKAEWEPAHTAGFDTRQTCIGAHVRNTSEIGTFKILSHDYNDGVWRLRWKIIRDED